MERLDAFMARANALYYATHDPFRDFTTAPEITQVFGELLGAWAAVVWEQMGRPAPVILAECGPGRGTLMADASRATARVAPAFHAAARIHLVETSPRLRAQQAARLDGATWHDTIDTLPDAPLILFANEFLDALPIRQFVHDGLWMERHVDQGKPTLLPLSPNEPPPTDGLLPPLPPGEGRGEGQTQAPTPTDSPLPPLPPGEGRGGGPTHGRTLEINEPARRWTRHLAHRLATHPGAALILDYGPARSAPGDTLQALHQGRPADPFEHPGSRDLTAHVDFAALVRIAREAGAAVHGPIPQGPFLAALGLFQRTGALARTQPPARAAALVQSAQRLAEPDRMGGLFKAMALASPALPTPPGFE